MKNLSDAQLAFYREQGYIVVDDVLPAQDLDAFARSIRRIVRFHIQKAQKAHDSMPEIPEGREFSDGMAALDAVDHSHIAEIYDTLVVYAGGIPAHLEAPDNTHGEPAPGR